MSDAVARLLNPVAASLDGRAGAARVDGEPAAEPGARADGAADFGAVMESARATAVDSPLQSGVGAPEAARARPHLAKLHAFARVAAPAATGARDTAPTETQAEASFAEEETPATADFPVETPLRPRSAVDEPSAIDLPSESPATSAIGASAPGVLAPAGSTAGSPEASIRTPDPRVSLGSAPAAATSAGATPAPVSQAKGAIATVAADTGAADTGAADTGAAETGAVETGAAARSVAVAGAPSAAQIVDAEGEKPASPFDAASLPVDTLSVAPELSTADAAPDRPLPAATPALASVGSRGVAGASAGAPPRPAASATKFADPPDGLDLATEGVDAAPRAPEADASAQVAAAPPSASAATSGAPIAGAAAPGSTPSPGAAIGAVGAEGETGDPGEPVATIGRRDMRRAATAQSAPDSPAVDAARASAAMADRPDVAPAGLVEPQETAGALSPQALDSADIPGADARSAADRADAPARLLARTIAEASDSGRIELRLDPPELGRVSIDLTLGEGTVSASVSAERPETLDLLRRHGDALQRELALAGFGRADIGFSDRQPGGEARPGRGAPAFAAPEPPPPAPFAAARASAPVARDRLDIRL